MEESNLRKFVMTNGFGGTGFEYSQINIIKNLSGHLIHSKTHRPQIDVDENEIRLVHNCAIFERTE